VPVSVTLKRVPAVHSPLAEVIHALQELPGIGAHPQSSHYLEVRVLLDGPEPGLRQKIETAIIGKDVRLSKIDVRYRTSHTIENTETTVAENSLQELLPIDVFEKVYQSKYNNTVPVKLLQLFNQASQLVAKSEMV